MMAADDQAPEGLDERSAPEPRPWWLAPACLFDGRERRAGVALRIEAGLIAAVAPVAEIGADDHVVTSPLMACPGFVDLQVNGGGGALFNNDPSPATLATIGAAHRRLGTTSWFATFITDSADALDRAVDAVIANRGRQGVAGVHIEGPHISLDRRGTHAARHIRPFDERTLANLRRLRSSGIATMLTVAPERLASGTIARLTEMGVLVSAGHSAATGEQVEAAVAEGLRCFTHLHNAMSPMTAREPGVVGAALASDAWCGLIADGHHVCDTTVALSLRARRRPDRTFLVSDAMATVGGPDAFELYGRRIEVSGGRLVNSEGALAGAHLDMATAVRYLVNRVGVGVEAALAMASCIPAGAAGLDAEIGGLAVGRKADILLLDDLLEVRAVFCDGAAVEMAPGGERTAGVSGS